MNLTSAYVLLDNSADRHVYEVTLTITCAGETPTEALIAVVDTVGQAVMENA